MTKTFEEEFNYLIELSGKVLIGQVDAEKFEENRVAFFEKYNKGQQQALPVVPECVAGAIESLPDHCSAFEAISLIEEKIETLPVENEDWLPVYNWLCEGVKNQDIFALAFITGKYEVEKPQLFYLKHIDMSKADKECDYFAQIRNDRFEHESVQNNTLPGVEVVGVRFTQAEIDSMQTGSYELVPVEDGE